MSNRASYQHHNPNMSIHKETKPKQPCLAIKSSDGVIFKPLDKTGLRMIARYNPSLLQSDILIDLINGKSFVVSDTISITLAFK